jgi:hypothetical protein
MCPVCITTAVLIAGSVASTGGLAAVAMMKFGAKNAADNHSAPTQSKESFSNMSTPFKVEVS